MKRRSGISTQTTPIVLISQNISADPSMTSLELKDHDSLLNKRPRLQTRSTAISSVPPKVRQGRLVFYVRDDKEFPRPAARTPTGNEKGRIGRRPPARTPPSELALSPKKPKAIKQAFEKPYPARTAPACWCETFDIIEEMRSRFPTLVDTMRCDTIKWKEMDPRVRDACHGISLNHRLLN